MATGHHGVLGTFVLCLVVEELGAGLEAVLTQPQVMEVFHVPDPTSNPKVVTQTHAQVRKLFILYFIQLFIKPFVIFIFLSKIELRLLL